MMKPLRALEEALFPHVSAINARVIVERSRRVLRDPSQLTPEDRAHFLISVRATLRLFASDECATTIVADLERRLTPGVLRNERELRSFGIDDERDLRAARSGAREACLSFATSVTDAQRVATAVSELARNILSYTPGGQIDLELHRGPPVRVRLIASDRGSGILHLEDVLSGRYQSRTGLGRGLIGVKRLMDQFRVQTGEHGTRIEAEVTFLC